MEFVNQSATRKSNSIKNEEDCNCKGNQVATENLTSENLRVLRLLEANSQTIKRSMEDAIFKLGISPEGGQRFLITKFAVVPDNAELPSPWGVLVGACCPDGTYQHCYTEGCDPCVGHY